MTARGAGMAKQGAMVPSRRWDDAQGGVGIGLTTAMQGIAGK